MYFCRNCGLQYQTDAAAGCVRCQAPKGMGNQFCPCCGRQMPPMAHVCMNCGVEPTKYGVPISNKSKIAAGLFGIFFGCFGVHNLYLGKKKRGFIQLGLTILLFILMFVGAIVMDLLGTSDVVIGLAVLTFLGCYVGLIAMEIWGFVEGILILCGKTKYDGQGRILQS